MNTTEKLKKIRSRCIELLTIAEKRAGAAEAGWKSTIAAIDGVLATQHELGVTQTVANAVDHINVTITSILAAWPEEMFNDVA